jgi:hypothetical protein
MPVKNPAPRARTGREGVLDRLLREKGLERYALFFMTGEGEMLPDGSEKLSGCVIDDRGSVHSFWLGWSAELGQPVLTAWDEERPEASWLQSAEYRSARAAIGLGG